MANSKYSDAAPVEQPYLIEHKVFHHDYRAFSPHAGSNGEDIRGQLALNCTGSGDWSWQPQRYQGDPGLIFNQIDRNMLNDGWYYETEERAADLERQMPTYRGTHA